MISAPSFWGEGKPGQLRGWVTVDSSVSLKERQKRTKRDEEKKIRKKHKLGGCNET